jgi:lon-related putative ATP-dependent protease
MAQMRAAVTDDLRLPPERLRRNCDPEQFSFATTEELAPLEGTVGQERALRAIDFGLEIVGRGYNVFATGPIGTGKRATLEARLRQRAVARPTPGDVVYLTNFDEPARPLCAPLAAGSGRRLADAMTRFIADAGKSIPAAFESESYQRRRAEAVEPLEREREAGIEQVRGFARERGLELELTPAGVATIPLVDGRPVTPQQFELLPDQAKASFLGARKEVEQEMAKVMARIREIDRSARERIREVDREVVLFAVGHLIDDLKAAHGEDAVVARWLERVREDVIENYAGFGAQAAQAQLPPPLAAIAGRSSDAFFGRYEVNVFVTHDRDSGAPVVVEHNPTFHSLFGRIEYETTLGAATTDHRRIKAGAIHRANGGYLLLQAIDVLGKPFLWDRLKQVLRAGRAPIENLSEQLVIFPTATLTPEPIELDVKVVLVGPAELYQLLYALDEDLRDLFRVKADFDVEMPWTGDEAVRYAAFIGAQVRRERLRHFDRAAVARVIEHSARRAEHQQKLSTRFSEVADLVAEASHWAGRADAEIVAAEHVRQAIEERVQRSNLLQERTAELIAERTLMIDLDGERVGQVNGLAVTAVGDYAFGHPVRITATSAPGSGEMVSIDREAKLSGAIHNKGFLILRGFLEQRYGARMPLSLSASVTFEQSYGGVEGDSAASTELYSLLSSLADAPIKQGIAVTGSVDQHGRIQAVGGVTEKIEGFYEVCQRRGLTGEQGVIMPAANARHLMLNDAVIEAVRAGRFSIWAVDTIDQGIELLTGVPAGRRGEDDRYADGTIHRRVEDRLAAMAAMARELAKSGTDGRKPRTLEDAGVASQPR